MVNILGMQRCVDEQLLVIEYYCNLLYISYRSLLLQVMNLANLHSIQLRTGCFCNPGACRRHLNLTSEDVIKHFEVFQLFNYKSIVILGHMELEKFMGNGEKFLFPFPYFPVNPSLMTNLSENLNLLKNLFIEYKFLFFTIFMLKCSSKYLQACHVCGDGNDLIEGIPTGSVRISFGAYTTLEDVTKFLKFVEVCFILKPTIQKYPNKSQKNNEFMYDKYRNKTNSLNPLEDRVKAMNLVYFWFENADGILDRDNNYCFPFDINSSLAGIQFARVINDKTMYVEISVKLVILC